MGEAALSGIIWLCWAALLVASRVKTIMAQVRFVEVYLDRRDFNVVLPPTQSGFGALVQLGRSRRALDVLTDTSWQEQPDPHLERARRELERWRIISAVCWAGGAVAAVIRLVTSA